MKAPNFLLYYSSELRTLKQNARARRTLPIATRWSLCSAPEQHVRCVRASHGDVRKPVPIHLTHGETVRVAFCVSKRQRMERAIAATVEEHHRPASVQKTHDHKAPAKRAVTMRPFGRDVVAIEAAMVV